MNTQHWKHKDLWHQRGKDFLVEVSRHTVEGERDLGPHRWAIYAYIYPEHPHFAKFDESDSMMQPACDEMPFRGGVISSASYFRRHVTKDGQTTSFQVGDDYNHINQEYFSHYDTPELAVDVFEDAEELFRWLTNQPVPQPSDA